MVQQGLSYAIDEQDRLIQVDKGYYRFAEENDWDGAGASLGRSLWDFVAGAEMRNIQRMLLRRVRGEVGSVELPFRCDSPGLRREMEIRIAPNPSGRLVLFRASLRAAEPREFQPLLEPEARRGNGLVRMCGWCDRFFVGDEWVEVEEAATQLELFRCDQQPTISHDICPTCSEMLLAA